MAGGEEGRGGDGVGGLGAGRLERRRERLQDRRLTRHAEHWPGNFDDSDLLSVLVNCRWDGREDIEVMIFSPEGS